MSLDFERFVAMRYLRSKRREVFISIITVISVLGVAVSVMVLDIVLAVMTGFEAELKAKLLDASAHINVRRYGGDIGDWQEALKETLAVPGVTSAYPYTYSQAMLSAESGAHGLLIKGIPNVPEIREKLGKTLTNQEDFERLFRPAALAVERPDGLIDQVKLPPLIIGRALRNRLGLMPDTPVTLFSPQLSSSPQGLIPKLKRFVVVGVYSSGLMEYESGLAYTSLDDAQRFFAMGNSVSGLEVSVANLMDAPEIAKVLTNKLQEGRDTGLYAIDWTQPNKPLWDAITLERRVYFIVLLLLILVASFSIVSTLVMVVMEKSKDIAILKTIGATDQSVMQIFLLQGAAIGLSGTALGTLLGFLGCVGLREFGFKIDQSVFSLTEVPVHIVPSNFVMVSISALIITTLAGVYPARRAARLNPAEALRFE